VFTAAEQSSPDNADRIRDFAPGEDRIDLSRIETDANNDSFTFVGGAEFTETAGELRVERSGGSTLVLGDTDGDGTADFALRLNGNVALTADDILL
jgi:serralysin